MENGPERTETFAERLSDKAEHLRKIAGELAAGEDRDLILRRARQLEIVLQVRNALPIDRWVRPSHRA
jgi:hypothetical protein